MWGSSGAVSARTTVTPRAIPTPTPKATPRVINAYMISLLLPRPGNAIGTIKTGAKHDSGIAFGLNGHTTVKLAQTHPFHEIDPDQKKPHQNNHRSAGGDMRPLDLLLFAVDRDLRAK
jgi:hypothetical protein